MTPDAIFPWESPGRAAWRCASCGFESPAWNSADSFLLCVSCDHVARFEARAPMRDRLEADRQHRQQTIDSGGRHANAISIGRPMIVRETTRALLIERAGTRAWVPKSLVDRDDGQVWVAAWFARKKLGIRDVA